MAYVVSYRIKKSDKVYQYGPRYKKHTARKLLERAVTNLELEKNLVRCGDKFYRHGTLICELTIDQLYKM